MLEVAKILQDIDKLGRMRAEQYFGLKDELDRAESVVKDIASDIQSAVSKIKNAKTSWLTATFEEIPDKLYSLPMIPKQHAVASSDGSQIMPSKHEVTICYLLNSAYIIIYYGTGERPIAVTNPKLFYRDEDLYEESYGGRRTTVNEKIVGIRRTLEEAEALAAAIEAVKASGIPAVALWDGSLIRWEFENEPPDYREKILEQYLRFLDLAQKLDIPVAGYVSDPGSKDFINSMRVMLCDQTPTNCDNCIYKDDNQPPPCNSIARLKDSFFFNEKMKPGERSVLFSSSSKILERYGQHRIFAFYLNAGREIVRIEIPEWVANNNGMIDLVQSVCFDQAQKGRGYPVALAEAHEHAVVKGTERSAFFQLLERSFIKHGAKVNHSMKRFSKGY